MKHTPIAIGDEIGFWKVINGPTVMKPRPTSPEARTHWWCRCRCNKEMFVQDSTLKRIRDNGSERQWSCGCVMKELAKIAPKRNCYDLRSGSIF